MLEKLIPDFREDAPLERHLVEQRFWIVDERSRTGIHYRSDDFNEEKPNRYTIIRAQFDKWFSQKVREAGATVLCETTVTEVLQDSHGRVVGVRTDRDGGEIHADVVVLAEGVNGVLGTGAGLRGRPKPDKVALAVKEMHFLSRETIDARFNLKGDEGLVIEAAGTISRGMTGMGFIYSNKECISLGIGCLVADFQRTGETPYGLLESLKRHPSVAPLIEGSVDRMLASCTKERFNDIGDAFACCTLVVEDRVSIGLQIWLCRGFGAAPIILLRLVWTEVDRSFRVHTSGV